MRDPGQKVLTRAEFEEALDLIFRLDRRLKSQDALVAVASDDPRGKARLRVMCSNVKTRKDGYLAQWDAAANESARDVVVGSVSHVSADFEISEEEIDTEVAR